MALLAVNRAVFSFCNSICKRTSRNLTNRNVIVGSSLFFWGWPRICNSQNANSHLTQNVQVAEYAVLRISISSDGCSSIFYTDNKQQQYFFIQVGSITFIFFLYGVNYSAYTKLQSYHFYRPNLLCNALTLHIDRTTYYRQPAVL